MGSRRKGNSHSFFAVREKETAALEHVLLQTNVRLRVPGGCRKIDKNGRRALYDQICKRSVILFSQSCLPLLSTKGE